MTRVWDIVTENIQPNMWQFIELGWHPETGLQMWSNNRLVTSTATSTIRSKSDSRVINNDFNKFFIGKGSGRRQGMQYGVFAIDELEYWFGNREYLLAHGYIQRGRPENYLIRMDRIQNGRVEHPSLTLPVFGNPSIVTGKINGALHLNGNQQYLDVGDFGHNCYGNLEKCRHGITGSMWVNFRNLRDNTYYLSNGGGIRIYYENTNLRFVFQTPGQEWVVPIKNPAQNKWQFVEYTWHPDKGLQVYIDYKMEGEATTPNAILGGNRNPNSRHYVGRANTVDTAGARYGDFDIDHYETWFQHMDYLLAWGYIARGKALS